MIQPWHKFVLITNLTGALYHDVKESMAMHLVGGRLYMVFYFFYINLHYSKGGVLQSSIAPTQNASFL